MKRTELPFGVYVGTLLFLVFIPFFLIWKIMLPVYKHNFPHFYHQGVNCHEHQYFFWAGIIVVGTIFVPLIIFFFKYYKFKTEPFWRKFFKRIVEELRRIVDFKTEPFAIPILVSSTVLFSGIVLIFVGTNLFMLICTGIGFVALIVFLAIDGWWQKKQKNKTPSL